MTGTPSSDLHERAGGGADAFAGVYHAYFEFAWASLRRLGVPPEGQEDALQDLFLVVHRRLPEFAGRSTLKTWIFGVARRVAARYRRTEARRQRRHDRAAEVLPRSHDATAEDELARREAVRQLDAFLDDLDDDKRAVFVLHAFEDMTGPQIAETLGLKVNTVYSRLRLVREQFDRAFAASRREAALAAGRADRPPEAAQRRVWAGLAVQLGGGGSLAAPGTGLAPTLGAKTASSAALPWAVGLAGTALLVVHALTTPTPSPAPPPTPTVAAAPAPATPPAPTLAAPEPEPEPVVVPPSPSPAPTRKATGARPSPAPAPADRLAAEAALIARVRAAIAAQQWDEALALQQEHARQFPDGALAREGQSFRAIALCRGGRAAQGRGEAAVFLRAASADALAGQVRAACEP